MKERILLAAIEEFGRKGYEAASTNDIVRNAGVSKGLLFHYYGSKKNLFMECSYYVFDSLGKYMTENLDFTEGDIFARIKKALIIKLNFYKEYPALMGMLAKMWYSDDRPGIEERIDKYGGNYNENTRSLLFDNLDMDNFREGVDFNNVVEYTSLIMEACWLRFSAKNNGDPDKIAENIDSYLAETDIVMDLIKHGAYKQA